MKKIVLILFCIMLTGCGTVTTLESVKESSWIEFDHKTRYSTKKTSVNTIYLTVEYSSYTFLDKSIELAPIAKKVFEEITNQIASDKGYPFVNYERKGFFESVGYNGLTGVSTVVVSNPVSFSKNEIIIESQEITQPLKTDDFELSKKLKELKSTYEKRLITEVEYNTKRKEIINNY